MQECCPGSPEEFVAVKVNLTADVSQIQCSHKNESQEILRR